MPWEFVCHLDEVNRDSAAELPARRRLFSMDEETTTGRRTLLRDPKGSSPSASAAFPLSSAHSLRVEDRQHFLRIAAHCMRQILIDYARGHRAQKRDWSVARPWLRGAIEASDGHGWPSRRTTAARSKNMQIILTVISGIKAFTSP